MIFAQQGESWFVDRVAIKVNDKIITEQELLLTYKQKKDELIQNYKGSDFKNDLKNLWDEVLTDAVDQLLLYEKAVELGIDISEETLDGSLQNQKESYGLSQEEFEAMILKQTGMTLSQYMEATLRYQSGQRVVQSRVWGAIVIDDPEIAKYYEEHIPDFTNPETFHVAEIVFSKGEDLAGAKSRAEECLNKLKKGMEFEKAVETYSDGASKAIKGDLGELVKGDLNKTLETAVLKMETGDVSPIIEIESSFYILKMIKRTPSAPKPLDEVKDDIRTTLREPRFTKALDKYLVGLRNEYLIDRVVKTPSTGY
jgi:parvulin-like peptidyl-prolyl isomerase